MEAISEGTWRLSVKGHGDAKEEGLVFCTVADEQMWTLEAGEHISIMS